MPIQPPTTPVPVPTNGNVPGGGSSNQNNRRGYRNKNKKNKSQLSNHQSSWKDASSGFDDKYISLAGELGTGRGSNFKETMQKVEVYVAENFSKSTKSMRKCFLDTPSNPFIMSPAEPGDDAERRLQISLHMYKVSRYHEAKEDPRK